jgi:hypothetical protein
LVPSVHHRECSSAASRGCCTCCFLVFQALLLARQHLVGDEPLVGELDQPGLVVLKCLDLAAVALALALDNRRALLAVSADIGPDRLPRLLGKAHGAVVLLDRPLNEVRGIVWAVAAPADPARVSVGAGEVLVQPTLAAILGVEQPSAAFRAVQAAT